MVQSLILTGPTAVGKSSLAVTLATRLRGTVDLEIINADTVCFYQGFDIGSAKPSAAERNGIPHHLLDVCHPNEVYHAGKFLNDCKAKIAELHSKNKRALIVGGSGFYLKALRRGLWDAPETSPEFRLSLEGSATEALFKELLKEDPLHAKKIGENDRYRIIRALEIIKLSGKKPSDLEASMNHAPNPEFALWILDRDRVELESRIKTRVDAMIRNGMVQETKSLREKYPNSKMLSAVGYAEVCRYLDQVQPKGRKVAEGETGLIDEIVLSHRQLAKQQRTFFKNLGPDAEFLLDRDTDLLTVKLMNFYQ